jgi:hypothetical protein
MKRAAELFAIDERSSRSPFVDKTWRTRSEPAESFISIAVTHWEMVVTRQAGEAHLTVRGPETRATTVPIPEDAEFFGIQFSLGTFMPSLPPRHLVDRSVTMPEATSRSFWLDGSARRVARATGLTRRAIRQIGRAERAVDLLAGGVPAVDAAHEAGYADQPHLIRSLKRFVGQTPSQIAASAARV